MVMVDVLAMSLLVRIHAVQIWTILLTRCCWLHCSLMDGTVTSAVSVTVAPVDENDASREVRTGDQQLAIGDDMSAMVNCTASSSSAHVLVSSQCHKEHARL